MSESLEVKNLFKTFPVGKKVSFQNQQVMFTQLMEFLYQLKVVKL